MVDSPQSPATRAFFFLPGFATASVQYYLHAMSGQLNRYFYAKFMENSPFWLSHNRGVYFQAIRPLRDHENP